MKRYHIGEMVCGIGIGLSAALAVVCLIKLILGEPVKAAEARETIKTSGDTVVELIVVDNHRFAVARSRSGPGISICEVTQGSQVR
jgi:hypothetical protein